MRVRALVLLALVGSAAAPVAAQAQRLPRARIVPRQTPPANQLPPEAPVVAKDLALHRSRWSFEGYPMLSVIETPSGNGAVTSSAGYGSGAHADYRYTDHLALTIDGTASLLGSTSNAETMEIGSRLRPLAPGALIRPYVDLRVGYMRMTDMYNGVVNPVAAGGTEEPVVEGERYANGLGAVAGAGFEYSLTSTMAFTTELSAMRDRMHTYRLLGQDDVTPNSMGYWLTEYRLSFGLKWNPVRALHSTASTQ